jgi:hypothetical protein
MHAPMADALPVSEHDSPPVIMPPTCCEGSTIAAVRPAREAATAAATPLGVEPYTRTSTSSTARCDWWTPWWALSATTSDCTRACARPTVTATTNTTNTISENGALIWAGHHIVSHREKKPFQPAPKDNVLGSQKVASGHSRKMALS